MTPSTPFDPHRHKHLRARCINLAIGRFVKAIDRVLAKHTDRGRPVDVEAAAIIRKVIEEIAVDEFKDSAVFMGDTPVTPHRLKKPVWEAGDDDEGDELELLDD